jgi:hypothetical protein
MSQAENANNTSRLSRRTALAGLAGAAAAGVAAFPPAAAEADPIFAVIAEHHASAEAYVRACVDPETEDVEEVTDAARNRMLDALRKAMTERPTTLLGVAALLEYLFQPAPGRDPEDTILVDAIGWDGDFKTAAMEFPGVLADTIRDLIGEQS